MAIPAMVGVRWGKQGTLEPFPVASVLGGVVFTVGGCFLGPSGEMLHGETMDVSPTGFVKCHGSSPISDAEAGSLARIPGFVREFGPILPSTAGRPLANRWAGRTIALYGNGHASTRG